MAQPIIALEDVHKSFGKTNIINGATLNVEDGHIHALIGPNGAGKSTLFNLISNQFPVTSGKITFQGVRIEKKRPWEISRLGLSRSFQQSSAFPNLSVRENLAVATMRALNEKGGIWTHRKRMQKVNDRVDETLALLSLDDMSETLVEGLAYSEARTLEIGMTIASQPKLVLLDEPTAGMSRAETHRVIDVIKTAAKGRTLVLIEHDMNVVFRIADQVSVLVYGQVIATGTPEDIRDNQAVREAYLGKAQAL